MDPDTVPGRETAETDVSRVSESAEKGGDLRAGGGYSLMETALYLMCAVPGLSLLFSSFWLWLLAMLIGAF